MPRMKLLTVVKITMEYYNKSTVIDGFSTMGLKKYSK